MRLSANFTLHPILAACLAAFAASSAAAAPPTGGKEEVYFTITLTDARAADGKGQHLEVHSYQWGAVPTGYKLDRVFVKSWSTSGDADAPPPSGSGRNEMKMEDSAGRVDQMQPGGPASGNMVMKGSTIGQNSAASGQATGKRQHKPMVMRGYYDQAAPPPRGSLTVLASGASCRVGTRYPSLALNGRGKSYWLQDVQVADCGDGAAPTEQITFVYGKVSVRGWDPEKKEQ